MLGFGISVHKMVRPGPLDGVRSLDEVARRWPDRESRLSLGKALQGGEQIAVWQTSWNGTDWLDALVAEGHALVLMHGGYPTLYLAQARHVVGGLGDEPPDARSPWRFEIGDVLLSNWVGQTVVDHARVEACHPDEWLLVVAWDES